MTEKIHGKNCRAGLIRCDDVGNPVWTWMAGSHDLRRKEFTTFEKKTTDPRTYRTITRRLAMRWPPVLPR